MSRTVGSLLAWLTVLTGVTVATPVAAQQPSQVPDSAISAAERAMQNWFGLLAHGDYNASWDQASRYFRDHVSREQWQTNAEDLAPQFHRSANRRLVEARWLRDEPPLPRAEYVVLRWLTVIDENRQVGERVIVAHEPDGSWRPATYDLFPNVEGIPTRVDGDRRPPPVPVERPHTITSPGRP